MSDSKLQPEKTNASSELTARIRQLLQSENGVVVVAGGVVGLCLMILVCAMLLRGSYKKPATTTGTDNVAVDGVAIPVESNPDAYWKKEEAAVLASLDQSYATYAYEPILKRWERLESIVPPEHRNSAPDSIKQKLVHMKNILGVDGAKYVKRQAASQAYMGVAIGIGILLVIHAGFRFGISEKRDVIHKEEKKIENEIEELASSSGMAKGVSHVRRPLV